MWSRQALVIGSQCAAYNSLDFVPDLAARLSRTLHDQGQWQLARDWDEERTAAIARDGLDPTDPAAWVVLDPDITAMRSTVKAAFTAASEAGARLLVAFIGHGVAAGTQDFYLLATDSLAEPDSDTGLHLGQTIREQLKKANRLDGLVVLVDACEAGEGVQAAGSRWTDVLADADSRMELLVASGAHSAYNGCFTRTLVKTVNTGLGRCGDTLLAGDLHQPLIDECPMQRAQHLAFNAGSARLHDDATEDAGLYIALNKARPAHALTGRPAAGLLDQVTRHVRLSPAQRVAVGTLMDHAGSRLRTLTGPAGCGKTTVLAFLIRPTQEDTPDVAPSLVRAAAFLDTASSAETVAAELAAQLCHTLRGFAAAHDQSRASEDADTLDAVERDLRRPLIATHRANPDRVHLLIDGVDQISSAQSPGVYGMIARLTDPDDEALAPVRVIIGARTDLDVTALPGLQHSLTVEVPAPTWADARAGLDPDRLPATPGPDEPTAADTAPVPGGWIAIRLANAPQTPAAVWGLPELARHYLDETLAASTDPDGTRAVVALLGAAGVGPILPFAVLRQALVELAQPKPDAYLRNILVNLGPLIQRGNAGDATEHVGISHAEIVQNVDSESDHMTAAPTVTATDAHRAIAAALAHLREEPGWDADTAAYAAGAWPRHYLDAGDAATAVECLGQLDGPRPADNRDRWQAYHAAFTNQLGPDHPYALFTRHNLANWRGRAGDAAGARAAFEALLLDMVRVLGPDHPHTLGIRGNIAHWRGEAGDAAGALTAFEALLPDMVRVLGPDHPHTLAARGNIALGRGEAGDAAGALTAFEALLPDQVRVLGPDHPTTLATRENIAQWRGEAGDAAGALTAFGALLPDMVRVLGPDHPLTLATRKNAATSRGQAGDAAGALRESEALLPDMVRVLGPDHPDTLGIRGNIAYWRSRV